MDENMIDSPYIGVEQKLALLVSRFLTFTGDTANMSKHGWDGSYDLKKDAMKVLEQYDLKTSH